MTGKSNNDLNKRMIEANNSVINSLKKLQRAFEESAFLISTPPSSELENIKNLNGISDEEEG